MIVSDTVSKHVLMVAGEDDLKGLILIVTVLQVLQESIVRFHARFFTSLLVEGDHIDFVKLNMGCGLVWIILVVVVHHVMLLSIHVLLLHQLVILINIYHFYARVTASLKI